MTSAPPDTSAALVADLEARTPRPIAWWVLVGAGAARSEPPAFLLRGRVVTLDDQLGLIGHHPFGPGSGTGEGAPADDLRALVGQGVQGGADRGLFVRNRFLLPRLARDAPFLLDGCRAVMVQAADGDAGRLTGPELAAVLAPFRLGMSASGRTAGSTVHLLFERPDEPDRAPADGSIAVLDSHVRLEDGFVVGTVRLNRSVTDERQVTLFADGVPVGIGPAVAAADAPDRLAFRVWAAPELLATAAATLSVSLTRFGERVAVRRMARLAARRFVPESLLGPHAPAAATRRPLGVLLLADAGDAWLPEVLEGLARRGAQPFTHLRLDGPADGAGARVAARAAALGFADVVAHRGAVGRDKSAVQGLWHMMQAFARVVVIEAGGPSDGLLDALDADPDGIVRRNGGWAAPTDRLAPLVRELAFLFSLEEEDYRRWTTEDGSAPADAFAWSDALSRLLARHAGAPAGSTP